MTQSTPTLAEAVGAALGGLIALGFSENQAKTIIVSAAITTANESKKITPTPPTPPAPKIARVIDCDGDPWEPVAGTNLFAYKGTDGSMLENHTQEALERIFGPLKKVWA